MVAIRLFRRNSLLRPLGTKRDLIFNKRLMASLPSDAMLPLGSAPQNGTFPELMDNTTLTHWTTARA